MFRIPDGLRELQDYCHFIYPDTPNKTLYSDKSLLRCRGPEPLDLINVYKNSGDLTRQIPDHWHYVSFGLSDIYSYGFLYSLDPNLQSNLPQLYPLWNPQDQMSGFGFELTFRLKSDPSENEPPIWPTQMMQDLARHIFRTKNLLEDGDFTTWHCPLGGEGSRIEHILMTLDPQLKKTVTKLGRIKYIQLVGVCEEEHQAAREWNAAGVLKILKEQGSTGGEWLVTDMRRGESIFELKPINRERIDTNILKMGSGMASLCANHKYSARRPKWFGSNDKQDEPATATAIDSSYVMQDPQFGRAPSSMSCESVSELRLENAEKAKERFYDNIYLLLNKESARVLPVVLRGRLAHRRPFHYKSLKGELLTTFIPEGYEFNSLVSRERKFVRQGPWLQIYVSEELRQQMLETITTAQLDEVRLPRSYSWPEYKFHLTIVDRIEESSDMVN